jgi:HEAT repeats
MEEVERVGAALRLDVSWAIPGLLLLDHQTHKLAAQYPGVARPYLIPRVDQKFRDMIPSLASCLHHTNGGVRLEAAKALGWLHEKASPAVPALREALDDRVIAVREAAVEALELIAPEVLTNGVAHF